MIPAMAIDASITATGWACHVNLTDGTTARRQGVIHPTTTGLARLHEVARTIADHARRSEARLIAIEDYPKGMPAYSIIPLAQLGGVIRTYLIKDGLPEHRIIEVSASTLKLYGTGKGRADKRAMVAAANDHFGWRGTDHNIADAVVLHGLLAHALGQPYVDEITPAREKAVATITPQVSRACGETGLL